MGDIVVCDMDKFFQGCAITEVSKVEAETFSQHLEREKKNNGSVSQHCVLPCLTKYWQVRANLPSQVIT